MHGSTTSDHYQLCMLVACMRMRVAACRFFAAALPHVRPCSSLGNTLVEAGGSQACAPPSMGR